jgi:flagellar hook-associated protein 2
VKKVRIGGLASGMDIDSLVANLMKAERLPLDKLSQKKQILEWQRDSYREMNVLLKELDTFIFDGINRRSNLTSKQVTSSDETAVSATAKASASNISTNIEVTSLAKAATWITDGTENFTGGTARTLSLSVTNGDNTSATNVLVNIAATDTVSDVIKKLNNKTELGITAFHDPQTDKIVISKKETGAAASLVLDDQATTDFFNELGYTTSTAGAELGSGTAGVKTLGADAEFSINGLATSRSTNIFILNDVTYTLKKVTAAGSPVTITTSNNTDDILKNVVDFANKYNEIIEKVNSEISEERYRSYKPLTNEEKEAMSEKQVEQWEERAKSGLLKGDSLFSSGLTKMRMDVYSKVGGTTTNPDYDQLSEIGITTSSNYLDKGKLIIDESKLRNAIEADPNAIYELFNSDGGTFETKGIARRLRDSIKGTITQVEARAGNSLRTNQQFTIGRNLTSISSQMERFEDRLMKVEDRYWRQFTAMEKAIQRSNEQSMFLMNSFGG